MQSARRAPQSVPDCGSSGVAEMKKVVRHLVYAAGKGQDTQKTLLLTNLDRLMIPQHIPLVYFFDPPSSWSHQTEFMSSRLLRDSLAQILALFWPATGKIKERENGQLHIEPPEEGVEFWEVKFPGSFVDEFGHHQPQGVEWLRSLLPDDVIAMGAFQETGLDGPPMKVQLSLFACGRVCVGVAIHHTLCDGKAATDFVKAWSDFASRNECSCLQLDRSAVMARNPTGLLFPHHEYSTQPPRTPPKLEALTVKRFKFSASQIQALKENANSGKRGQKYSAFDALAGHVWKHITAAREVDPEKEVKLLFAVDGRPRFIPPLPSSYFGNAVHTAVARTTAGVLVSSSLSHAASLILKEKTRCNDEYLRSTIDWMELQRPSRIYMDVNMPGGPDVIISSWTRFVSYETDFGWGTPTFCTALMGATDRCVIFFPALPGSGEWHVLVGLMEPHMAKLQNSTFLS